MITGRARLAGVIGWPVAHSLSPRLHNYWLKLYGIDGAYVPLAVRPEDLPSVIRALPRMGFRGVNLTLPHKEVVLPLVDHASDESRRIGAVNTLVFDEQTIIGMNTDAYGFAENIRPCLPQRRGSAVVLGAGGAARAVCLALLQVGFSRLVIVNRTEEKARRLAELFQPAIACPWEERNDALEEADLLVNTTSAGMAGKPPLAIDLAALPLHALVTDIVYTPLMTPLLAAAQARGNPIVDGLGMLLHQAVPGFEAWFGVHPEVTLDLRQHVLHA